MTAEMWIALGALVVSVVAALFTGLSTWYSRGQLDAARRQADVAEAALEFQKRVHELQAREGGPREWRPSPAAGTPPAVPPGSPAPAAPSDAPQAAPEPDAGIDWTGAHEEALPQEGASFPSVSPWTVSHVRGDRYHLTNGSEHPVHDVTLEVGFATRRPAASERWDRIDPGDPTAFRAPRPASAGDRALVVSWAWSPDGPRQEWVAELPARR